MRFSIKNFNIYIPICFSIYEASSEVALGIIPGSVNDVLNNADIVKKNNMPPITGISGDILIVKYGQLEI